MIVIDNHIIRLEDVSYIGKTDKYINHGHKANITFYFAIVVGGQTVEIKSSSEEGIAEFRNQLQSTR